MLANEQKGRRHAAPRIEPNGFKGQIVTFDRESCLLYKVELDRLLPLIVERIVTDIDAIVRLVRFPGWQNTLAGEREVKKALRKALFQIQTLPGGRAFRESLWLYPTVLLTPISMDFGALL